jgi:hypothetical protein
LNVKNFGPAEIRLQLVDFIGKLTGTKEAYVSGVACLTEEGQISTTQCDLDSRPSSPNTSNTETRHTFVKTGESLLKSFMKFSNNFAIFPQPNCHSATPK